MIYHQASRKIVEALEKSPALDQSTAKIKKYTPNEIIIDTKMEHPGFLILTDAFHPDWEVFVDGQEGMLYQTHYLLRAVFLQAGDHVVRFVFRPASFYWGGLLSFLSLIFTVSLFKKQKRSDLAKI